MLLNGYPITTDVGGLVAAAREGFADDDEEDDGNAYYVLEDTRQGSRKSGLAGRHVRGKRVADHVTALTKARLNVEFDFAARNAD
ncbi:hypothetical protein GJ744_005458 [Endocarpon pusillum]|uniref:Uncharacterized protein n=1 Tax=Endocarpon pusillum TaxID=364733 RepID=A0A8H7A4S4_9EURO|nr:hypothetical protein GJ744_005458 [Endocarpon pusillum]